MRAIFILLLLVPVVPAGADSLFTQAAQDSGTLVSEPRARFRVGDIITIIVNEKVTASTSGDTNTRKKALVES